MTTRKQLLQKLSENALTDNNVGYSTVMRMLHEEHPDLVRPFMISFKQAFDEAWLEALDHPEELALLQALKHIGVEEVVAA